MLASGPNTDPKVRMLHLLTAIHLLNPHHRDALGLALGLLLLVLLSGFAHFASSRLAEEKEDVILTAVIVGTACWIEVNSYLEGCVHSGFEICRSAD